MSEQPRTVVITGASRGLGLASAKYLYDRGWHVLAAMRNVDVGLKNLRRVTGASDNDPRLMAIALDLDDKLSIASSARDIIAAAGAPDFLVHNAGVAAVGCAEDMTTDAVQQVFSTNFFGPVLLTNALLPAMRARRRGRIVVVSSLGGLRGLPATSTYSAAKAALERWAESLAYEIAPFGLGASIVVAGSHRTEILTDGPIDCTNLEGAYAAHYQGMLGVQARFIEKAASPERFAESLSRALDSRRPFSRHVVGTDAKGLILLNRLPESVVQAVVRRITHIPAPVRSP